MVGRRIVSLGNESSAFPHFRAKAVDAWVLHAKGSACSELNYNFRGRRALNFETISNAYSIPQDSSFDIVIRYSCVFVFPVHKSLVDREKY